MDSEELYNSLSDKIHETFEEVLSKFLDNTDDEDIQGYNTFDDVEYFSLIWIQIKKYNLRDLAVKFINKLMLIKKEEPTKNKFMMGFANNSENTLGNLSFLGNTLSKEILDKYTTPERKILFEQHTGKFGGKRNRNNKKSRRATKRTNRKVRSVMFKTRGKLFR
jgi:hypothetical protein